jgi:hypothetical protein
MNSRTSDHWRTRRPVIVALSVIPAFLLGLIAAPAAAETLEVGRFSAGDMAGWKEQVFKGNVVYSLARDAGKTVLKAHSDKAASGLTRELTVNVKNYPFLRWSWKVTHSLKKEDVTKKSGDDFAARVYVIFPRTLFWRMRAINYVWAARMPKGSGASSPYTANAYIIAVESGDEHAGQWIREERNIFEDYRRIFGEEPPPSGGIAIMSDTDDTGDQVTTWYGDIELGTTSTVTGSAPARPATKPSSP